MTLTEYAKFTLDSVCHCAIMYDQNDRTKGQVYLGYLLISVKKLSGNNGHVFVLNLAG